LYEDRWITCGDDEIRALVLPVGTKRIPYRQCAYQKGAADCHQRKAQDLGHGNPRYWASLDPRRATKQTALILDLGRSSPLPHPRRPRHLRKGGPERAHLGASAGQTTLGPIV